MKILLLGSGGREYALALKLRASAAPVELVSAPGSDALAELGHCVQLDLELPASVAELSLIHISEPTRPY